MITDKAGKITYRRKDYTVPKWARWVATDEDGSIFTFSEKPYFRDGYWYAGSGLSEYVAQREEVKVPGNTLEEIKVTKPHFVMIRPAAVHYGDVITAPSPLYADGWFPLIKVSCFDIDIGGEVENGPTGTGARTYWLNKGRDYVFKKVTP